MKADVQGFPKMWYFSKFGDFKLELWLLKVGSNLKIFHISDVQKKRHGHNFPDFGSTFNQRGKKWVTLMLIEYGAEILKIVAVSFFLDVNYF